MATERIRERMEMWARYRWSGGGSGSRTFFDKVLRGMPGTNCPACAGIGRLALGRQRGVEQYAICSNCGGAGKIRLEKPRSFVRVRICPRCRPMKAGDVAGEIGGRTCHRCRGSGKIIVDLTQVNPAFIHSTYLQPDNLVAQRIDRLVCELRQRDVLLGYWLVIHAEYCDIRGGTQVDKADRVGIAYENYKKRLTRALEWIEAAFDDTRPVHAIPWPWKALDKSCPESLHFCPD